MKAYPVILVREKLLSSCHGFEHTTLAFLTKIFLNTAVSSNQTNNRFGLMDVQVVTNNVPFGRVTHRTEQVIKEGCIVFFGPCFADGPDEFAGSNIESTDEAQSPMTSILEFLAFHFSPLISLPWAHWQRRRDSLQSLNSSHLINRDCAASFSRD